MKPAILFLAALGVTAGCAGPIGPIGMTATSGAMPGHMNLNQCNSADWREIGREDGRLGRPPEAYLKRQNDCWRHGFSPDEDLYRLGYAAGAAHRSG